MDNNRLYEVGKEYGLSEQDISTIEKGLKNVSKEELLSLKEHLNNLSEKLKDNYLDRGIFLVANAINGVGLGTLLSNYIQSGEVGKSITISTIILLNLFLTVCNGVYYSDNYVAHKESKKVLDSIDKESKLRLKKE